MRGVAIDNIESRLPGADGRVAMPLANLLEIIFRSGTRLPGFISAAARDAR